MEINVIGLGYIGLPTAAMFATKGFNVTGVDVDAKIVDALNDGEILIEEPFLGDFTKSAVKSGKLKASLTPTVADVYIICVPTPVTADKKADLRYVESAARSILPVLREGATVILESTCPPQTTTGLLCPILQESGIFDSLYIAHSPERVLPGKIIQELENNSRVIGGINKKSAEIVADLYKSFVKGDIFLTDATTAEMCKLMENTYRDVNIALANELAKLCEAFGINAWDVIRLANMHPRVNLHQPGPGVGGHCISVDPWFIVEKAPALTQVIGLSRKINDDMPSFTAEKCAQILGTISGKKVVLLGVTYKPDVDDMRESPIKRLCELLTEKGANVLICDPHVKANGCADNFERLAETLKGASLAVLGVNHSEFKYLDLSLFVQNMETPNLLDTRNFFDGDAITRAGINYFLLGCAK